MLRPIWSGSISFGLVNIPVKLYSAVKRKAVHFHQLRKPDGCRIRLKKVCSSDGQEVPAENIMKGYELSQDNYVVVTPKELESLYPEATRGIGISDFVLLEQIDPVYFEQTYYVAPDQGATKAYSLLLTAMRQSKKTAIAKMVIRNKEYLACIRPSETVLMLSTMFFADEIVSREMLTDKLPPSDVAIDPKELDIALKLVESLSTDYDPQKYHDEYRERLTALIESKAEGQQLVTQQPTHTSAKVVDLMAALEASLSAMKKKKTPPNTGKRKKSHA